MSYQNWVYTNPGWNNNTPPSLSSSNLNDIASALEKLNITDEQIAAIKQNLTDVTGYDSIQQGLGQLISVLATARSKDVDYMEGVNSSVTSIISSKPSFDSTSYVGNDQKVFSITMNRNTDLFFIITNGSVGWCDRHGGLVIRGAGACNLQVTSISGNRFTISITWGTGSKSYGNEAGITYYVYYFY